MYDEIILRWKQFNPTICHGLGIHDYDGEVLILTDNNVQKRINEIEKDLLTLNQMSEPIDMMEKYEYNLLKSVLEIELYELRDRQEHLTSPLPYIFGFSSPLSYVEGSYTIRSFATINERIKSIIKLESKFTEYLSQAEINLKDATFSKPVTTSCLDSLSGFLSYYTDELISFVSQTDDNNLLDEWSKVNEKAVEAMQNFYSFLNQKLDNATEEFALGTETFMTILEKTEGVSIGVERLLAIAEKDLERNYSQLQSIANENAGGDIKKLLHDIELDFPMPEEMIEYTTLTLDRTRQFLIEKELVTIPSEEQCKVIHTPKSARKFAFAAMNTPGPFEVPEASEAYYWITPPEAEWDDDKTREFMKLFNKSSLESITVHEAWPGHYLQLLFSNTTKSDIAKMFASSYAMVEGWGHYTEEMMFQEGYEPFDRDRYHVGQLLEALIRNVRFVCAIKLHCFGMTVEEATHMFMEKAFQSEVNAFIEARRGTIDPMYLNYTLGKLMIMKLREDYKKEQGDKYSLRHFHDTILSFGSPPITVLRKMMLSNPSDDIL